MEILLKVLFCTIAAFYTTLGWSAVLGQSASLPSAIQACINNNSCQVSGSSDFALGDIAAFQYQEAAASGYLIRYPVTKPSSAFTLNAVINVASEDQPALPVIQSELSGSIWLRVWDRYPVSNGLHSVDLFVDKVFPENALIPRYGYTDQYPDTLHFQLSTDSLSTSRAFRAFNLTESGVYQDGDLNSSEPILSCLAIGCYDGQELNLVGVSYINNGTEFILNFNSSDARKLLYKEYLGFDSYDGLTQQYNQLTNSIFVQPVPLPSSWLFLASGIGAISQLIRKRRYAR